MSANTAAAAAAANEADRVSIELRWLIHQMKLSWPTKNQLDVEKSNRDEEEEEEEEEKDTNSLLFLGEINSSDKSEHISHTQRFWLLILTSRR